tara:strand:+ start:532 stop:789 length:258 start_codon:yes stop_codon:yes gene_type:complete
LGSNHFSQTRPTWAAGRLGGTPPLGYDIDNRKLVINKAEAETVRYIFEIYLKTDYVVGLLDEMRAKGITGKNWITQKGKQRNVRA